MKGNERKILFFFIFVLHHRMTMTGVGVTQILYFSLHNSAGPSFLLGYTEGF